MLRIGLVDESGKPIKTSGYYSHERGRGGSYSLTSSQKIPKGARLRVSFVKGGKLATLPFEYELDLP